MRRAISLAYFGLIIIGALFAMLCMAAGFKHALENIGNGRDWWHHPTLSNAGIGVVLLSMTIAFGVVYRRRADHYLSPLAYMGSYLTTAFMLLPVFFRLEKGETLFGALETYGRILLPIIVTLASLTWIYRRGPRAL